LRGCFSGSRGLVGVACCLVRLAGLVGLACPLVGLVGLAELELELAGLVDTADLAGFARSFPLLVDGRPRRAVEEEVLAPAGLEEKDEVRMEAERQQQRQEEERQQRQGRQGNA